MECKSGIYKITNIITNVFYIGSSVDLQRRWREHKRELNKRIHTNSYLQNSWDKYGEDSFIFEIIEFVNDLEKLIVVEQTYLDQHIPFNRDVIFNLCETAGNMLGFKHSEETKKLLSNLHKGNKYSLGHKHSVEFSEKRREIMLGTTHSDEVKNKIKQKHIGKRLSEETKEKLSNSSKAPKPKHKVMQMDLNGELIKTFDSLKEAAESIGVNISQIAAVCRGDFKTCRGFKWSYLDYKKKKKLNDDEKEKIKELYKTSSHSIRTLAEIFSVGKTTIWGIVKS